ncbi:hypothetical protein TURU_038798 [Turdus rufiventris]|nr:hypothetical protein TURU_038798 [Turdus rufiventris]
MLLLSEEKNSNILDGFETGFFDLALHLERLKSSDSRLSVVVCDRVNSLNVGTIVLTAGNAALNLFVPRLPDSVPPINIAIKGFSFFLGCLEMASIRFKAPLNITIAPAGS